MGAKSLVIVNMMLSLSALLNVAAMGDLGYTVERYDESPGIYYENRGVAALYNTAWRTIVYMDLGKIDNDTLALRQYVHHVEILCQMSVIRNWTGCAHFSDDARSRLNQLTGTEDLLREITGRQIGGKRKRRGVFNFIGELSKVLFGTMDEDDARYYNEQIKLFEQNSGDTNSLLKEQLSVMKSSLGAVNSTLVDVEYNENLMKVGISNITRYMDTLRSETSASFNMVSAKIEIEGHILKVTSAMNAVQRNLDLLIDSVVHAQKGMLQPQVISPTTLMESLMRSAQAFPKDTTLPFPLSKDSTHVLFRLCDLQVYIKNGILGYVIQLPLVSRGTFDIYRLIPIPIALDRNQFLYIETGKPYLWIDQARQYYFLTGEEWIGSCNILNTRSYVCRQNQPLLSSHLHENCMVRLLQMGRSVPPSCEKRVVEISNSVWTQLANNEWIYFVPKSEGITVLCGEKPPVDVTVSGIGKLGIKSNCKGFGKSALFQTHSVLNVDSASYDGNFLSKVHLDYDCCEGLNNKVNISTLKVNTNFHHVVSHLDDLKIASRRIADVENMIKEQEWKQLHTSSHKAYSTLTYILILLLSLYVMYKLYYCLKSKAHCLKSITDANGSGNIVNIKIHTSNESLAMAQEDVPLRELNSQDLESTPRRSNRLRTSKSCF
jgi:hypothetical protein